jgi:predicted nucleotide-binding protein
VATRKPAAQPPALGPGDLAQPRAHVAEALEKRISAGRALEQRPMRNPDELGEVRSEYIKWNDYNSTLIERAFTTPKELQKYTASAPIVSVGYSSFAEDVDDQRKLITRKIARLESLLERLDLFTEGPGIDATAASSAAHVSAAPARASTGSEIFIVHGHDTGTRESVARLIKRVTDIEPVILHEQPNKGQTVIEKLETSSINAGFAAILLTADDEGGVKGKGSLTPRGRQNVVLEAGYFMGKLGRSRTAILYEPGVELPSDITGIVYIALDEHDGWHLKLAKELRAAGFIVDMDKL